MIRKFLRTTAKVLKAAKDHVVNFVKGAFEHAETTSVLVLASFGASAIISEMPFYVAAPMWIESAMVIPVVSVMIVMGLVKLAELRARHRGVRVVKAA